MKAGQLIFRRNESFCLEMSQKAANMAGLTLPPVISSSKRFVRQAQKRRFLVAVRLEHICGLYGERRTVAFRATLGCKLNFLGLPPFPVYDETLKRSDDSADVCIDQHLFWRIFETRYRQLVRVSSANREKLVVITGCMPD